MSEKPDQTRKTLLSQKMGFNQMRNSLYWLQRYMKGHNLSSEALAKRFLQMGKNIGASFAMEIIPESKELKSLLKELYKMTVNSKVKVNQEGDLFTVHDPNCALCKYQYDDINLAGCTIEVGMIYAILTSFGYKLSKYDVIGSKVHGDKFCSHQYHITKVELLNE
jgi:hypothetical protein